MENIGELLDVYASEMEIASAGYEMMGRMLDRKYLESRLKMAGISNMFIYGGGYLGIQLYYAINQSANVLGVVDKSGKLLLDIPDIPVISMEGFSEIYKGQDVIITPIKFYQSIFESLSDFVPEGRMMYLGEFLGGRL